MCAASAKQTDQQPKLCIDCKHHFTQAGGELVGKHCCGLTKRVDVVTGEKHYESCRHMRRVRRFDGGCGPNGKLWESKD